MQRRINGALPQKSVKVLKAAFDKVLEKLAKAKPPRRSGYCVKNAFIIGSKFNS
jgi:hypothetical protein